MSLAPHVSSIFPAEDLEKAIEDGYVNRQSHPEHPLFIYNYSAKTQYSNNWTPVTENCRGLILDKDEFIAARPFAKFFNHSQVAVPKFALTMPPLVTEKQDGSLGVVFYNGEEYQVSTRGSFTSDQALWATKWLHENMPDYSQPDEVTTLVEIIYPENRIVLDYKGQRDLVLLAAIDNRTGADIPFWEIDWWPGSVTEMHTGFKNADEVYSFASSFDRNDKEGVVCCWLRPGQPSFRLKIKGVEYLRLHRILCSASTKTIWEALAKGESPDQIAEIVPDEFYNWVKDVVADLRMKYYNIETIAQIEFDMIKGAEDRKSFAEAAKRQTFPSIMFSMLDGKSYSSTIWAMCKPDFEKPFVNSTEEEI